jgi:hypothetical protein
MKKENLTRRNFLRKGAAVAAASSIIAIERSPTIASSKLSARVAPVGDEPVTTEAEQIINNKTFPRATNILGTEYLNIREFPFETGGLHPDITDALNAAIAALSGPSGLGGQILIPHGFYYTKGGHNIPDSISIEGTGMNLKAGVGYGTNVRLKTGNSPYVFRIDAPNGILKSNVAIKNLSIWLADRPADSIGLWMTGVEGGSIHMTHLQNVQFYGGQYGIKVESSSGHVECILNRFEHVSFNCKYGFSCNSINGGYTFDNCGFTIPGSTPSSPSIALDIHYVGNMSVEHCLFGGTSNPGPFLPITDGSTILKTYSKFNNITFKDCQDELVQYYYRNDTINWPYNPVVLKNTLIQSAFKATANASVVLESCMIGNIAGVSTFEDTSAGFLKLYLKGLNNSYTQNIGFDYPISHTFVNSKSEIIREALYGAPLIATTPSSNYTTDAARGIVLIGSGQSSITISNSKITADSIVFAQLRTSDPARIREVSCSAGVITINLTSPASSNLSVAFKIDESFSI